MTSIEGKLCQVCIETFQGMTMSVVVQETKRQQIDRNGKSLDRIHHQNQSSLVTSKNDGCFICSWLWAKIPPVLRSEEFESSPVRTFCQVAYAFLDLLKSKHTFTPGVPGMVACNCVVGHYPVSVAPR
jgi:hypothetical protein